MQFVIRTSPIIHLVSRQTFCITFLFGVTVVPREIEDNAYAKFGGQTRCIMGDVQVANMCFKKSSNVEISTEYYKDNLLIILKEPYWLTVNRAC